MNRSHPLDPPPPPCLQSVYTLEAAGMRAKLVKIGNSRGVRLPKPLIEEAGLDRDGDEVELRVEQGAIVITSVRATRSGWAEAARVAAAAGEPRRVDEPQETRFDREGWRW
ncbi:MAG: AbrB/MazE/SpoVT family DNA-binding domain-containing protein [Phycisphaerales bacterium]